MHYLTQYSRVSTAPGNNENLLKFLIPGNIWNFIGPPGNLKKMIKLQQKHPVIKN